jgi:site-specific recombinase XerD
VNPDGAANRQFRGRYEPRSVLDLVKAAGIGAGVSGRHFTHPWPDSYTTSLLRVGVDIHKVQRLMGHSNIATTVRYLLLVDKDTADAVDAAFPEDDCQPYRHK